MARQVVSPVTEPPMVRTHELEVHLRGAPVFPRTDGGYRLAFVGDQLWAQRENVVHRLFRENGLLLVPTEVELVRATGQWVEFRVHALRGERNGRTGELDAIWLYDALAERWHAGPWPEELECFVGRGVEPEDLILELPRRGLELDLSGWGDRHWLRACAPDGRHVAIDDRILDLVTAQTVAFGTFRDDLNPEDLPVIGPTEDRSSGACAEALVRHTSGDFSWIMNLTAFGNDALWEAGIGSLLGRGREPIAWVGRGCVAAAFTEDASRVAFMSDERVWVVDAATPTGPPLLEHAFSVERHVEVDDDLIPF